MPATLPTSPRHGFRQAGGLAPEAAAEWRDSFSTVLLVDDDPGVRASLQRVLAREGLNVITAADGDEALWSIEQYEPDLVITDLRMAATDGWDVLARENRLRPQLPIFVITALPPRESCGADQAADEFFQKPLDLDALIAAIHRHLGFSDTVTVQPQS